MDGIDLNGYTDNTLIGLIVSTIIRLSPELFKLVHKYMDNKHELAMVDRSTVISNNTIEDRSASVLAVDKSTIDSIVQVWNTPGGSKKIDVFNQLVRPNVVYILIGTFVVIKLVWFGFNPHANLTTLWSKEDQMLLSGVLNFFFLNRVFDKR